MQLRNPIILALDVDDADEAIMYTQKLGSKVGCIKLGPRLVVKYGEALIQKLAQTAPIFVDCKFLDIPSTMDAAVRASFHAGASFVTVHAWAGPEALKLLANTEKELSKIRPFKILVVSILTSFKSDTLAFPMKDMAIDLQVQKLVQMSYELGLRSFVCSPHESALLKQKFQDVFLVTPGVRMPGDDHGDQKRVMTPREAMANGASALVVGRSLLNDPNAESKLNQILESI